MTQPDTAHLAGQTILITGASRGIGAATARFFAAHSARVALLARNADQIQALADDISSNGGDALALACDVTNYAQVATAVAQTTDRFGTLDILVNNAGLIDPIARLEDTDPMPWGQVVDVNLKGAYHALRACLEPMRTAGHGTIINISSGAATSALEGWSHYCATKAALLSLTRCAHKELAPLGLRVHGLSPGTVATDMQTRIRASGLNPVSRLAADAHIPAEWVAQAIGFLCSDAAAEFAGDDFSLKTDTGRALAGLPALAG